MEIKVMCKFESTFKVPEDIIYGTKQFENFVAKCIGSDEMLMQEVTASGLIAIKKSDCWEE